MYVLPQFTYVYPLPKSGCSRLCFRFRQPAHLYHEPGYVCPEPASPQPIYLYPEVAKKERAEAALRFPQTSGRKRRRPKLHSARPNTFLKPSAFPRRSKALPRKGKYFERRARLFMKQLVGPNRDFF